MVEALEETAVVAANELDAATKVAKSTTAIVEATTLDVRGLANQIGSQTFKMMRELDLHLFFKIFAPSNRACQRAKPRKNRPNEFQPHRIHLFRMIYCPPASPPPT